MATLSVRQKMPIFSCIYNPQITVSPTSSFSASFNGNRVKNHPIPWTCPLSQALQTLHVFNYLLDSTCSGQFWWHWLYFSRGFTEPLLDWHMLVFTGKRSPCTGKKKKRSPVSVLAETEHFVWLAGGTLYPGSRSKCKIQLNKIASDVSWSASKTVGVHCHTSHTPQMLEAKYRQTFTASTFQPPTPLPWIDRSKTMSVDCKIPDRSISIW